MEATIRKNPQWTKHLARYINASMGEPFAWGANDCTTFAIGAIEAMAQRSVVKPKLAYKTELAALRFAKRYDLKTGMETHLGAYRVGKNFQTDGDIVIVPGPEIKPGKRFYCAHVIFGKFAYGPVRYGRVAALSLDAILARPDAVVMRFD